MLFVDAIHVKIRDGAVANRPVYVVLGVTASGHRDILGLWAGEGGEGAKYWQTVLTEVRNRGVRDVLMPVCDGLGRLPDDRRQRVRGPGPARRLRRQVGGQVPGRSGSLGPGLAGGRALPGLQHRNQEDHLHDQCD